jgi:hypothetical protein
MRKVIAIVFLALAIISLIIWAISQYLIPVLPAQIGNSVILFFVALNSTVALIASFKDVLEFFQVVSSDPKEKTKSTISQSLPFPEEGRWVGNWTSPNDYSFKCEINLLFQPDKTVKGYILWTLRSVPDKEDNSKLNSRAIEYVIGSYSDENREIEIRGVEKEDPNEIISPDLYRLTLSSDSSTLRGETQYVGDWHGAIVAKAQTVKNSINQAVKV